MRGSCGVDSIVRMLAMTGTMAIADVRAIDAISHRIRGYQSVRVSATQRVVLIPPIGSFLIDWDDDVLHLHIAANSQRDLDELVAQLSEELRRGCSFPVVIDWVASNSVPVPFR